MRRPIPHPLLPTNPYTCCPFVHEWDSQIPLEAYRPSLRRQLLPRFYEIPSKSSGSSAPPPSLKGTVATKVDWKVTADAHVLKVEVPGMKKEDMKVVVEAGDVVKVIGEVKRGECEGTDEWRLKERGAGKLLRTFKLDGNPKMEEIQAKIEDGVLTITVPKDVKLVTISG